MGKNGCYCPTGSGNHEKTPDSQTTDQIHTS